MTGKNRSKVGPIVSNEQLNSHIAIFLVIHGLLGLYSLPPFTHPIMKRLNMTKIIGNVLNSDYTWTSRDLDVHGLYNTKGRKLKH